LSLRPSETAPVESKPEALESARQETSGTCSAGYSHARDVLAADTAARERLVAHTREGLVAVFDFARVVDAFGNAGKEAAYRLKPDVARRRTGMRVVMGTRQRKRSNAI
jgi:hypothetical protein